MIRPLDNRILIKPIYAKHEKFIIPTADNRWGDKLCVRGEVLALGSGTRMKDGRRRPIAVNIGQVVHFSDSCGRPVTDADGSQYLIIREDDVAFIEEEPIKEYVEFLGARDLP